MQPLAGPPLEAGPAGGFRAGAAQLHPSRYPSRGWSARTAGVQALAGWFPVTVQIAAVM